MLDQYCEDCGLIYSKTPFHQTINCNSAMGGVALHSHDVAIGSFYIWDRSAYSSNQGGGFVSTVRSGQGGSHAKTKIMYIDLQDFVNNLQDVLGEIYSYLTRNAVTVEVVVHGTRSQHFKAKLTETKKGKLLISKKLSWMKLIGIKLSLIVFDDSSKTKFKTSRFRK